MSPLGVNLEPVRQRGIYRYEFAASTRAQARSWHAQYVPRKVLSEPLAATSGFQLVSTMEKSREPSSSVEATHKGA